MKIFSEKTNKYYSTVEECLAAEKNLEELAKKRKEDAEKETAALRKKRANEVEDAYKAVLQATKQYKELLEAFIKDYGSFHMTIHPENYLPFDIDSLSPFSYLIKTLF